jgi:hypothetical protein
VTSLGAIAHELRSTRVVYGQMLDYEPVVERPDRRAIGVVEGQLWSF